MRIRHATPADLDRVVEIYNQAVADEAAADIEAVTVESRRAWFSRHSPDRYPILVAEQDGQVVGWASLGEYRGGRSAVRHTAEISYYVHADHRGHGIGSSLLREALDACAPRGIRTVFAILLDDNAPSIRLLEKMRFEEWGHLPCVADFHGREVGHLYYGRQIDERTTENSA